MAALGAMAARGPWLPVGCGCRAVLPVRTDTGLCRAPRHMHTMASGVSDTQHQLTRLA